MGWVTWAGGPRAYWPWSRDALATLVEDLMEISPLDAGMAPMTRERVDMGAAVAGALTARGWDDHVQT